MTFTHRKTDINEKRFKYSLSKSIKAANDV